MSTINNINEEDTELNNKYWMSSMKISLIHPEVTNSDTMIIAVNNNHKFLADQKTSTALNEVVLIKQDNCNNNGVIRVCSDCSTTTTPLWRSGPRGPKSLCNACGIRQRKARRAMAEAAAAANNGGLEMARPGTDTSSSSMTNNEKKKKLKNMANYKRKFKLKIVRNNKTGLSRNVKNKTNGDSKIDKLCFGDFLIGLKMSDENCLASSRVFPKDVAEAALLLMELSCSHALIHS